MDESALRPTVDEVKRNRFLSQLTRQQRLILSLHFCDTLTVSEVADVLGIGLEVVKSEIEHLKSLAVHEIYRRAK